jgi:CTD small phosphatase-like protein 2
VHHRHRPLIVLDLDETLVHASVERCTAHDVSFVVDMGTQQITVYVKIRPFAKEFLQRVSQLFEVCVFTASLAPYADQVVDYLDPARKLVHHRLFREHCSNIEGSYIKDLRLLGRPMERVAIVDNSPVAYSFQPENAVPITSWFDDASDNELLAIMPLLEHFSTSCDIFSTNRRFQPMCRR